MIKIIFKIETKNHIYELKRLNNTFAFVIYDKVFFIAKTYYLQLDKYITKVTVQNNKTVTNAYTAKTSR